MLEILNISKRLNKKEIIKNVSFSLRKNEIIALVGPNGAGKTTLLNLISNLIQPDEGEILLNKSNISNNNSFYNYISFMQDSSILYGNLTGYQHLKFIAKIHNKDINNVREIIKTLNMSNYINKKTKKYSLGMKQHLILGMSLISQPKILILDEPLNGLDPESSLLLRNILLNLKNEDTAILFSSHVLSEVDKIADKIIFVKEGEIISIIDNSIHKDNGDIYTLEIDNISKVIDIFENNSIKIEKISENRITIKIETNQFNEIMSLLLENDIQVLAIEKAKKKLSEDYYYDLLGGNYE
ncbi:ABC transporter ATP-binding protein [Bacillus sp. RS11]|uniref:ABC transporter ATP-binding protein n=1 Tax=Lysinibacillus sp. RS11 TaxID=3242682 RepID=UPI0035C72DAC